MFRLQQVPARQRSSVPDQMQAPPRVGPRLESRWKTAGVVGRATEWLDPATRALQHACLSSAHPFLRTFSLAAAWLALRDAALRLALHAVFPMHRWKLHCSSVCVRGRDPAPALNSGGGLGQITPLRFL